MFSRKISLRNSLPSPKVKSPFPKLSSKKPTINIISNELEVDLMDGDISTNAAKLVAKRI